jgi:hypothetical protein
MKNPGRTGVAEITPPVALSRPAPHRTAKHQ